MDTEINNNGTKNIDSIIEDVRKYTLLAVSQDRYEHSVRVAETSVRLCEKYSLDTKQGYLAGIGHDMCKGFNPKLLLSLAMRDGNDIKGIERKKPSLLHGRAAAVKLREDFGVENKDVLEAVAVHTFGKVGMCDLAKVVYVADKIEPGRPHVTKKYLEKLEKLSLDELMCFILDENIAFLTKKGRQVSVETVELFNSLKTR